MYETVRSNLPRRRDRIDNIATKSDSTMLAKRVLHLLGALRPLRMVQSGCAVVLEKYWKPIKYGRADVVERTRQ